MSLDDVRWTWACQEPGCDFRRETPPLTGGPDGASLVVAAICPRHGLDSCVRVCAICAVEIAGKRADAETCSGPCRAEKSRRERSTNGRAQTHTGARAKRAPHPRPRTPERGIRVYLLPDELRALHHGKPVEAAKRAKRKLVDARRRLARRSS